MSARFAPGSYSGAACLLWHDDRMVFEIQKPAKWVREAGRPPGLGLGCIGGTVEEGETPMQTMRREALEEIGCPLKISSARITADITDDSIQLRDDVRIDGRVPAMLWTVTHPNYDPGTKVAVFLGVCQDEPQPGDLPAIALGTPHRVFELLAGEATVAQARETGVEFRQKIELPQEGRLLLANTLKRLVFLGTKHPDLYNEFLQPR